ncbi:hypothetical protein [Rummeliibacillus stabekisii]|uniref:hypothetical protein n=1 Tax=Rummeliibacillus stabekisii TaxID=241244 RepID=UPI0037118354
MSKKKDKDTSNIKVEVSITGWKELSKKEKHVLSMQENRKKHKARSKTKSLNKRSSQSIRKAPRVSRSASSRRWNDLRLSDGVKSEVKVYKLSDLEKE